jgi:uncharacterized damage-inducible protein DinB
MPASRTRQAYHCIVIDLLRSLFSHQAWADAALLHAVQGHPQSVCDEQILKTLQHIVMAQRLLLSRVLVRPFDVAKVSQLPDSFDRMIPLFREAHGEELAFVNRLTENDLERRFDMPILGSSPTVADGLIHIVMHSQNHRGQCLVRLRENGVKPPTLDYILWARDRPAPDWPSTTTPANPTA